VASGATDTREKELPFFRQILPHSMPSPPWLMMQTQGPLLPLLAIGPSLPVGTVLRPVALT
jgi:hypothetical protein